MTDATGEFAVRGFLGDYEIVVDYGGRQTVVPWSLARGGSALSVVVPEPNTWVLLLVGSLGIGAFLRFRNGPPRNERPE